MKVLRHAQGALSLETIEARPIFEGDSISDLQVEEKNRAKDIIEDFMIAANGVTVRYLSSRKIASIRRVVRVPKRWNRIVEIAAEHGFGLPVNPDSKALEEFLIKEKAEDPLRFPDLSLAVIKLLGSGEYIVELPEDAAKGNWVRLLNIPIEGMLRSGFEGIDVGDRIRVQLISVDVERGFIDFKRIGPVKALI